MIRLPSCTGCRTSADKTTNTFHGCVRKHSTPSYRKRMELVLERLVGHTQLELCHSLGTLSTFKYTIPYQELICYGINSVTITTQRHPKCQNTYGVSCIASGTVHLIPYTVCALCSAAETASSTSSTTICAGSVSELRPARALKTPVLTRTDTHGAPAALAPRTSDAGLSPTCATTNTFCSASRYRV